ncbi:hypothetical protein UY3_05440 [Chelonia mydas]|uniref:Uncharacterized protein n=1 Tax=Chelonia mydas TaxID=8469 RepID=M7BHK0_CHEMY|nr:hypothetical protein UY3_05440 [Chelonia mydas]
MTGGTVAGPSAASPAGAQRLDLAKVIMAAEESSVPPLLVSPPEEAPEEALPIPLPPVPLVSTEVTTASFAAEGDLVVVGRKFTSIFEEIEALGLTPAIQGEDGPLLEILSLGSDCVQPPPPLPSLSSQATVPAGIFEAPLSSSSRNMHPV